MDYSYNYGYLQQFMDSHKLAKKDLLEALGCGDYVSLNKWLDGKVPVHVTSVSDVRDRILAAVEAGEKGYVCVSNMRTVVAANRDPAYLDVMEHSLLNVPDGTPLVWCGKAWGLSVERVVGLDLFTTLLKDGVPQFFLGDTEETLEAVKEKA